MKKNKLIIIIVVISVLVIIDLLLFYFTFNKKDNKKLIQQEQPIQEEQLNIEETQEQIEQIVNDNVIDAKKDRKVVTLNKLVFEYDTDVKLKDILEINIEGKLDTEKLGQQTKEVLTETTRYVINYKVTDTTPPIILGTTTKKTTKGKKINLVNKFMCGDNHDDKPNCYIEGDYDFNKVGTYSLKYVAKDSSGNKTTKSFKLKVTEPPKPSSGSSSSSSSSSSSVKRTSIKTYIKKYKKENTKIGIDVSEWQGNINWEKVKKAGVEFAMLRIGFGPKSNGEIKEDKWFKNNLKGAKKVGIPVGVYLYSYAKTEEEAKEQVKWINKKLNGEKLELPIAFDWENWSSFNKYKVSFKKLNDIAETFIEETHKYGYEGILYSSAYYLNIIWKQYDNTWLAYYTSNNDFKKPYIMWQLSSKGKVSGISGSVDIDVLYEDKNVH